MTLKNAALLALIGTILMTALLLQSFVLTFLNVLRGLVPAVTLFQSFIYAVACFRVAAFLPVLQRLVVVIPAQVLFLRTAVARVIRKEGDLWGFGCRRGLESSDPFQRWWRAFVSSVASMSDDSGN